MKYFKRLVGEKCYLAPINMDDAKQFAEWINDVEVTKYLLGSRLPVTLEDEENFLKNFSKNNNIFSIVDKELNQLIGSISLMSIDYYNDTADLGVFIGDKDYWNKGYGSEAIVLILDHGFNFLNLNNISLNTAEYNVRAIKSFKKIGFKEIGKKRKSIRIAGNYYDTILMDIIQEDFESPFIKKLFSEQYEISKVPKKIEFI